MPTETPDRIEGLSIGDIIALRVTTEEDPTYYKIKARDKIIIPYIITTLSAGSANQLTDQTISELNPPDLHIYQITEVEMWANIIIRLTQAGIPRFGTNSKAEISLDDRTNGMGNPTTVNVWIDNDRPPHAYITNNTPVDLSNVKVLFVGWKYLVEKQKMKPATASKAVIAGF